MIAVKRTPLPIVVPAIPVSRHSGKTRTASFRRMPKSGDTFSLNFSENNSSNKMTYNKL